MSGPGEPETCQDCGGPMVANVALVNYGGRRGCERIVLPARCPSRECERVRGERALHDMVARGIIDP